MSNNLDYNLTRLSNARTNIASAITAKGGTVVNDDGFEDFVSDIGSIPSGTTFSAGTFYTTKTTTNNTMYYSNNMFMGYIKGQENNNWRVYEKSYLWLFRIENVDISSINNIYISSALQSYNNSYALDCTGFYFVNSTSELTPKFTSSGYFAGIKDTTNNYISIYVVAPNRTGDTYYASYQITLFSY